MSVTRVPDLEQLVRSHEDADLGDVGDVRVKRTSPPSLRSTAHVTSMRSEARRSDGGNSADFTRRGSLSRQHHLIFRRITPLCPHGFRATDSPSVAAGRGSVLSALRARWGSFDCERTCVGPIVVVPTSFDLHATTST